MFCKEKWHCWMKTRVYFMELLKTKFEEAGLKDFQNILEHMRDDDPKEKDKLTERKNGKKSTMVVWDSRLNGLTDVHVHAQ